MAKVFLSVDDRYNVANSGSTLYGATGFEQVAVYDGVTGLILDANIERVDFVGSISDYTFQQAGNTLRILKDGLTVVERLGVEAAGKQLTFADGSVDVMLNTSLRTFEIGGAQIQADGSIAPVTWGTDVVLADGQSHDAGTKDYRYDLNFSSSGLRAANITGFGPGDTVALLDAPADLEYIIDTTGTTQIDVAMFNSDYSNSWTIGFQGQSQTLSADVASAADLDAQLDLLGQAWGDGWLGELPSN